MKRAVLLCILFMFGSGLMALSSTTNSAPFTLDTVEPEINIITPNGGEAWYIGDTNDITWSIEESNLTSNTINISYLLGGTEYLPLAENIANSGSWPWLMPEVQSYSARVKITALDDFGNLGEKVSGTFSITYVPPAAPENMNVDISNNIDAVIAWDPVTQTIYSTPITPDGYIVLYNETPYEDDQFYYFLGRSYTTTYTHHDVAEFRDQMFYRVLAYKNYRGDVDNVLNNMLANPDAKISLAELKTALRGYNMGGEK